MVVGGGTGGGHVKVAYGIKRRGSRGGGGGGGGGDVILAMVVTVRW